MSSITIAQPEARDVRAERRRIPRLRKRTFISLVVLALAVFAAVFAGALAPHSPSQATVLSGLTAPQGLGGKYILGTDAIGRDVLSRLLFGIRTSLIVGAAATAISAAIGITLGMLAGYTGSVVEFGIMRFVDFMMSLPGILVVLLLAFALGPGLRTTIIALGVVGWAAYTRMTYAGVRVANGTTYVLAARSVGCTPFRIATRYTFPNVVNALVVLAILQFGGAITAEAAISFLGFGIQSPGTSLGIMLSEGRDYLQTAWWLPLFPGVTIFAIVLFLNLCGEGLQDWLDPVRRRR